MYLKRHKMFCTRSTSLPFLYKKSTLDNEFQQKSVTKQSFSRFEINGV